MTNKLLFSALIATAFAANANAATVVKHTTTDTVSTAPVEKPYTPVEGGINYTDKSISNYQDPYATNDRAYKSNQFGEAAPAPRENVFSEYVPPTYRSDNPDDINTNSYTTTYVSSSKTKQY